MRPVRPFRTAGIGLSTAIVMSGSTGDGMSAGQWLPLVGLTLSAFIFNTSEFMPIGLLTDIAVDLHVTEARAGMLISV